MVTFAIKVYNNGLVINLPSVINAIFIILITKIINKEKF